MARHFISTEKNKFYLSDDLLDYIICSSVNGDDLFYFIEKNDYENQKNGGPIPCGAIKEINGCLYKWITDVEIIENEAELELIDGTDVYLIIKAPTYKKAKGLAYKIGKPLNQIKTYEIQIEK